MHALILFASGRGSNVRAIIDHFKLTGKAAVALIVCNRPDAGVLDIAKEEKIPFLLVDRETINGALFIDQLRAYRPSLLVLAGFLWKIPDGVVAAFPGCIVNIHPALLPAYGGKGMYGDRVHQAVIEAGEQESGITIHYVNEVYDEGNIILQARCPVSRDDHPGALAGRIHRLEHYFFPRTLEFLLDEVNNAGN